MFTPLKSNPNFSTLPHHYHAQNDVASISLFHMLKLRPFNLYNKRRRQIIQRQPNLVLRIVKPVCLTSSPPMADVDNKEKKTAEATVGREKFKVVEKPEPPEKPEAGDCCGSGCVRCVWDVYYDELDAYNEKLKEYNSINKS